MKLARWNPFHELVSVSVRLNRTVDHSYSNRTEDSFGPWARPIDILERQDHSSQTTKPKKVGINAA